MNFDAMGNLLVPIPGVLLEAARRAGDAVGAKDGRPLPSPSAMPPSRGRGGRRTKGDRSVVERPDAVGVSSDLIVFGLAGRGERQPVPPRCPPHAGGGPHIIKRVDDVGGEPCEACTAPQKWALYCDRCGGFWCKHCVDKALPQERGSAGRAKASAAARR